MKTGLDFVRLYRTALRIRLIESRIAELYSDGSMRCPVHLSIGQEIPSAIMEQVRRSGDTAISTHRAHAHYLAMGGDLSRMIAEIYGKSTGCSKGRGGSMHLVDLSVGFLGSSAIVGNSIPIGVGVGYAKMFRNTGEISFIFLGDAATEEGAFFESANFAVIHKLPVVFIVENNFYSVYTGLQLRQPTNRSISELAQTIGLRSHKVADSEFNDAYQKLRELVQYSREGHGPSLLEISTYRKLEHCGPNDDDALGYRPSDEVKKHKEEDLIENLAAAINLTLINKDRMVVEIRKEIDEAFAFAEKSPFPSFKEATEGVYAT